MSLKSPFYPSCESGNGINDQQGEKLRPAMRLPGSKILLKDLPRFLMEVKKEVKLCLSHLLDLFASPSSHS